MLLINGFVVFYFQDTGFFRVYYQDRNGYQTREDFRNPHHVRAAVLKQEFSAPVEDPRVGIIEFLKLWIKELFRKGKA